MKLLIISTLITIGLIVSFVVGIFSQATALTLGAFCSLPLAIFVSGVAVGRVLPRIIIKMDYASTPTESILSRGANLAERRKHPER